MMLRYCTVYGGVVRPVTRDVMIGQLFPVEEAGDRWSHEIETEPPAPAGDSC